MKKEEKKQMKKPNNLISAVEKGQVVSPIGNEAYKDVDVLYHDMKRGKKVLWKDAENGENNFLLQMEDENKIKIRRISMAAILADGVIEPGEEAIMMANGYTRPAQQDPAADKKMKEFLERFAKYFGSKPHLNGGEGLSLKGFSEEEKAFFEKKELMKEARREAKKEAREDDNKEIKTPVRKIEDRKLPDRTITGPSLSL